MQKSQVFIPCNGRTADLNWKCNGDVTHMSSISGTVNFDLARRTGWKRSNSRSAILFWQLKFDSCQILNKRSGLSSWSGNGQPVVGSERQARGVCLEQCCMRRYVGESIEKKEDILMEGCRDAAFFDCSRGRTEREEGRAGEQVSRKNYSLLTALGMQ